MGPVKAEESQLQVRLRIISTIVVTVAISAVGYKYTPAINVPNATTTLDKLIYTLRWQVFSFLTLFVGVQIVAMTRLFTTAVNPMDKAGAHHVEAYNRCLQNTLEQLVMNVPGQLILCTYLEVDGLAAIPFLVGLFVVGRILFWVGYPDKRAVGFSLTMLSTVSAYALDLYFMFTLGPSFGIGQKEVS